MVVGDLATAVDVLVIGGGPGGYVAAIRAAQLGRKVTLVTAGPPGGTCLHEGCIPLKALLAAVDQYHRLPALAAMGIRVGPAQLDWPALLDWSRQAVARLAGGVAQLLAAHRVEVVSGRAWFIGPDEVRVDHPDHSFRFKFADCVVATGARYPAPPGALTPAAALQLPQQPAAVAITGNDYVAAELATLFARAGTAVSLDTGGAPLLPEFDPAAGRQVQARLKQWGVHLGAGGEAAVPIWAGTPLPHTADLDCTAAGITLGAGGAIVTDAALRTANPHVYAAGDVTGGPPLATGAIAQAKVAAEALCGLPAAYEPRVVPRVAHTDPEVAAVGLAPARAKAEGRPVRIGRFPFGASGRALTLGRPEGQATVVADAATGLILGVTLVGAGAGELIGQAALALEMGATLEDLALTLHPHPGLGEAVQEAAEAALDRAVHVLKGL